MPVFPTLIREEGHHSAQHSLLLTGRKGTTMRLILPNNQEEGHHSAPHTLPNTTGCTYPGCTSHIPQGVHTQGVLPIYPRWCIYRVPFLYPGWCIYRVPSLYHPVHPWVYHHPTIVGAVRPWCDWATWVRRDEALGSRRRLI